MTYKYLIKKNHKINIIIFIILLIFSCKTHNKNNIRPENWSTPLIYKGLPNFYKVNDNIFRGAQPNETGFNKLKELEIKTIINLRKEKIDYKYIKKLSFKYYHLPINPLKPDKELYKKYIEIIKNQDNFPVFIHCQHGADRTGVAIALYRINIENWTVDDALNEMINGGYGFHKIYKNLIKFVKDYNNDMKKN